MKPIDQQMQKAGLSVFFSAIIISLTTGVVGTLIALGTLCVNRLQA